MYYSTYFYPTTTGYWTFEIPFFSQVALISFSLLDTVDQN